MPLTIQAPAKVNLYLHVTGKRQDGYHLLESLIAFTDVYDVITISNARECELEITGSFAQAISSEDNIILKAVKLLADRVGIEPNIRISLQKEIPIGAGLGGGSSDAAAVLRGLIQYWGIEIDEEALMGICLQLGADVPIMLKGKTSFVTGIGEHIKPITKPFILHAVLVNPGIHLATPHVFKQRNGHFTPTDLHAEIAFHDLPVLDFLASRHNDLEEAAIRLQPMIRNVLYALIHTPGCKISRMSGSGSTCFGIFGDSLAAERAAEVIRGKQPGWWVRKVEVSGE